MSSPDDIYVPVWSKSGHWLYSILGEYFLISSLPGKALRTLVHAFSKKSLVSLISKDGNMVFYLSVYKLVHSLTYRDNEVIIDICVDSASFATSFKKCNVIMT